MLFKQAIDDIKSFDSRLYLDSLQIKIFFNPFLNKFWMNGWRSVCGLGIAAKHTSLIKYSKYSQ